MEKVHGANMAISITPEGGVAYFKRNGPIPPQDRFFGFRTQIPQRYEDRARALAEGVRAAVPGAVGDVVIFGELFGGV
jgi:hypothetical protein